MTTLEGEIVSLEARPDLEDACHEVTSKAWPEFMLHDAIMGEYWGKLYSSFPAFQFALVDPGSDRVLSVGNSIPIAWEGKLENLPEEGVDWGIQTGVEDRARGATPRLLCAMSITVLKDFQRRGISQIMIGAMRDIGRRHNLKSLIAPVRPNLKSRYPLIPIERYAAWRRPDGLPFDPWMRAHARLGASTVHPCRRSMRIEGTVPEWEAWAEMQFPETGSYVIPGALVPVEIDREADRGLYVEPNVWMVHPIEAE